MLGKQFAASIAVGTFAFPFFLSLFQNLETLHHLADDPLLAAICAGVLDGVGLGLVIRIGGSTGGMDVPAIILNRKFGWKPAPVISATDILIFLVQLPMTKPNGIILGILYALIYSVVMHHMILLERGGMQMMICSLIVLLSVTPSDVLSRVHAELSATLHGMLAELYAARSEVLTAQLSALFSQALFLTFTANPGAVP